MKYNLYFLRINVKYVFPAHATVICLHYRKKDKPLQLTMKRSFWDSLKIFMPVVGLKPSGSNLHASLGAILKHSWAKALGIDAQLLQIYILHIQHYYI